MLQSVDGMADIDEVTRQLAALLDRSRVACRHAGTLAEI